MQLKLFVSEKCTIEYLVEQLGSGLLETAAINHKIIAHVYSAQLGRLD